jgi:hypothetical protein
VSKKRVDLLVRQAVLKRRKVLERWEGHDDRRDLEGRETVYGGFHCLQASGPHTGIAADLTA